MPGETPGGGGFFGGITVPPTHLGGCVSRGRRVPSGTRITSGDVGGRASSEEGLSQPPNQA